MKNLCHIAWIIVLIFALGLLFPFSYANASGTNPGNIVELPGVQSPSGQDLHANTDERNNFDIASLLSLLGIGLLKFVDDKLKIKLKDKFKTYKQYLVVITVCFVGLETAIIICYNAYRLNSAHYQI